MTTKNDPEKPKRTSKKTSSKPETESDHEVTPKPKRTSRKADVKKDPETKPTVQPSPYFTLDRIMNENADYNIIIGERGNGKTFAIQKHLVETFLATGKQCFLLRRWMEDVKGAMAQNFWDGNLLTQLSDMSNGRFTSIVYRNGKYICVSYDDKGKPIIDDNNTIGFVWDVNESERLKGQSFPNVQNIVYEEFISLATLGYIPNELTFFLNIISTIVRDRTDVKIWLLGNTVNPYNPFFEHFGINGLSLKQGEIWTKFDPATGCKVALEFCSKRRVGSIFGTSAKYFAFGTNDGSSDMIVSGQWQIPDYPTCKFVSENSRFKMYIRFDEKILELHIMSKNRDYFVYVREISSRTTLSSKYLVLDLVPIPKNNCYTSLANVPPERLPTILFDLINNNKIWFDTKLTGSFFYNFMAQSMNNKKSGLSMNRPI